MMKRTRLLKHLPKFAWLLLLLLVACTEKTPEISWAYNNDEIFRKDSALPDSIRVDIYLDATTSMLGFSKNSNSTYNRFLEELETTAGVGWKSADVRLFKFGTRIKEISERQYKNANQRAFYSEPGIFEKTNIDLVINQTDSSRVSVVITDLFQDDNDVISIVRQIKDRCFKQNVRVAFLGIPSEFDGRIFDLRPGVAPYNYKSRDGDSDSYRPFYVLMFGDPKNIEHLFENLKSQDFVKEENFLLISPYLMRDLNISLKKTRDSKGLNNIARKKSDPDNLFRFSLRDGYEDGVIETTIEYQRNHRTPDFNAGKLDLLAFKKQSRPGEKSVSNDSSKTSDIEMLEMGRNDDGKLSGKLKLKLSGDKGYHSYLVKMNSDKINGLLVPEWVKDFSSTNPTRTRDANKTLNLEKFVNDLLRANLALSQPTVAKMYITVKKL